MSTVATFDAALARTEERSTPAWLSLDHAATIFTSAFLLFQVQPLISKYILPWFGGSPAVWTTAMLFFQILLFAGYTYAHLLTNWCSPKGQGLIHGSLLLAAIALLPITPDDSWKPTGNEDPTWRILCLLAATVGLPYFVLSTTGPLVQAWFSRAFRGRSPYRLYSLSNVGSLLALVSYPFVIEPAWNTATQSQVWSALFVVFAALCAVALLWNGLFKGTPLSNVSATAATPSTAGLAQKPTALRRLLWVVLPALASLLLLATTNHVCQDVAVVPFLWVIPLSLYLLTFIISFDHARWYQPLWFGMATLLASLAVAGIYEFDGLVEQLTGYEPGFTFDLALYFLFMFLTCMTCHGELVRLRPEPRYLTEFYLLISAGGALGGLFVGLVAPRIFNSFFEWKIALVASFVVGLATTFRYARLGVEFYWLRRSAAFLVALAGMAAIVYWQTTESVPLDQARNFFGVVSVMDTEGETPADRTRMLRHGAIAHGRQYLDPAKRHIAGAYYYPDSGLGKAMEFLRQRGDKLHVGTIGLGIGTVATFARPGDVYRFYEINPEVVRQANEFFTFLQDCKGQTKVVLGDGRLALEREPPQQFDLLIIDAFSGDSIPMHLATVEAFEIYKKHLKSDGILAVNITNSYIDIFPMLRSMADRIELKWTRRYIPFRDKMHYRTDWLLLTNNEVFLDRTPSIVPEDRRTAHRVPPWTDHNSNLWSVLR